MNEAFYQMYKSTRDLVADFGKQDLDESTREYIESLKNGCDRLDRTNDAFIKRWQNERFLLFRFHKGGLSESMETLTIIESFEQLICIINEWFDSPLTKITIEPYIYDHRIDWDTQLVMIKVRDQTYPVGYLNKKPQWNAPKEETINVD